jgi:hypothetical protein
MTGKTTHPRTRFFVKPLFFIRREVSLLSIVTNAAAPGILWIVDNCSIFGWLKDYLSGSSKCIDRSLWEWGVAYKSWISDL